ncbi:MAG: PilN domain-containing protein [Geminicoccaceae bacterium]
MADQWGAVLQGPAAFLTWWFDELKGLLPQAFRQSSVTGKPCLILTLENNEIVLIARSSRRGEREIGRRITGDDHDATGGIKTPSYALAALGRRRYRRWPLIVRLPGHLGLRKQVDLPLAARHDLAQLLHFELDRLTPFKADDVRFAWRILEIDKEAGRMQVALEMAPKAKIDKLVDVALEGGREVKRVELEGDHGSNEPLDLLPSDQQASGGGGWLNRTLGITTFVLLALAFALPIKKQMAVIDELDADMAVLRAEAEESLALRQRLARMSDEARFLTHRGDERVNMIELLAELTRLLPDESHLRQLRIANGSIELAGLAESPSELVAILDRSSMLTSPTFSSPVIRDRRSGRDLFQISMSLTGGGS